MTRTPSFKPLVFLGAGGHARVLLSLARVAGRTVDGVCDPALAREGAGRWHDVRVLGDDDALAHLDPQAVELVNGVGQLDGGGMRQRLFERCKEQGFSFATLVHPSAVVDANARLGEGVQVMAGTVVQAGCRVGDNSILNTRASVDHDCTIGAHVHVAPGATLCGDVTVADGAFVGAGATALPGVAIGLRARIAAGATLASDLPDLYTWHAANGHLAPPKQAATKQP